jgi:membrane fusion protein (multidrug efflux system)
MPNSKQSPNAVIRWFGMGIVASAIALSVGCSRSSAAESTAPPALPKIHVETVAAGEEAVPKLLHLTGVLSSNERTDLAANASGRVVKTFVERGDHVKAGELLAQLDTRSASLSHTEAEANVASATETLHTQQTECKRYATLLAHGAISQAEYDRQTSTCQTQSSTEEAAKARLAQAGQTVSDASIRAPFAGVIAERFVHVGDYVHPDTRVVTLLVDDPLRLELTVPEANISSVHPGLAVTFASVAVPNRTFTATVKYMGGEIREATRDLVVEAIADNRDHVLLPGMFVTADLPTGQITLPVIPQKSVIHHPDNSTVFVVVSGHLEERVVELGPHVGDQIAIADGIKKGDIVVVSPPPNAADGMEVD